MAVTKRALLSDARNPREVNVVRQLRADGRATAFSILRIWSAASPGTSAKSRMVAENEIQGKRKG